MKTKSIKITLLSIIATVFFALAIVFSLAPATAKAHSMQSATDKFDLTETSYEVDERFVYTATVNFNDGQAAGLVFGAEENSHYWVFNIDRHANRVKLLYFFHDGIEIRPVELLTDYFIGNDKMTASEAGLVNPKVATLGEFQLKVIVSPETDGVHAEFYADNIRRFGVDNDIVLDELALLPAGESYEGGFIGYNCFNANVEFKNIFVGLSDYSYYTELYRNQFHYSQYAHWNNDPNGLVYFDGYYHLYYQTHPFNKDWGDMYWGHARSTDLAHWELLPICLFPDADWGTGNGYMWSGSAYEYRLGDSAAIDTENWFPNGSGNGIIAFYTRDGGMQDQMIMSSDDGGMTWTKRKLIPQTVATGPDDIYHKVACRDPKIFPIAEEDGKTTAWGMALTGQQENRVWFLKSTDLLNWTYATKFECYAPECPDVVTMEASDGEVFTIITLTAREYILTKMSYDGTNLTFTDKDGGAIDQTDFRKMDFGPDSYATQTFSIRDNASAYFGKTVSLSWFAGVPATTDAGIYREARHPWNGGGFTIPVIWNIVPDGTNDYILTQTPITKESTAFTKTLKYSATDLAVTSSTPVVINNLTSHIYEMQVAVTNPNDEAFSIKVNVSDDEYTEIGWNATEGYFADRIHTADAGLSIKDYHFRFNSGARSSGAQNFYILVDNGGIEVFCEDFKIPFYLVTLSSPYANGIEISASGDVTVDSLTIKEIATVWRLEAPVDGETVLYVSTESVELDTSVTTMKTVTALSTSGEDVDWSIESGNGIISLTPIVGGVKVTALAVGSATIKVVSGDIIKMVSVTVNAGGFSSDLPFNSDGIIAGSWISKNNSLVGHTPSGDGYILSSRSGQDFTCAVSFSLDATAAAVILRAEEDMSNYIIVNYDRNEKVVKSWSKNGEIARVGADIPLDNIVLKVELEGTKMIVFLNGNKIIDVTLGAGEPTEGYFGLNVFSGTATFKSIILMEDIVYQYAGIGNIAINGDSFQGITAVYNKTLNNSLVSPAFYTSSGKTLSLNPQYFENLTVGEYVFKAVGHLSTYEFTINVTAIPATQIKGVSVQKGVNASIYLGNVALTSVSLNGTALTNEQYKVENRTLTLFASVLNAGDNTLTINGNQTVTVKVTETELTTKEEVLAPTDNGGASLGLIIGLSVGGAVLVAGATVTTILLIKKRRNKVVGND
ncbi:MAG: GH32 C-terminal domain-containing protein [Clostridia bacterium]|nr:GH32 C-terminal domain-containing protein [Clostridia bacterium]